MSKSTKIISSNIHNGLSFHKQVVLLRSLLMDLEKYYVGKEYQEGPIK